MPPEMGITSSKCDVGVGGSLSLLPPPSPDQTRGKPRHASCSARQQQLDGQPRLNADRIKIGVFRHPVATLWYFGKGAGQWVRSSTRTVIGLPAFGYAVVPGSAAWLLLRTLSGPHSVVIEEVEHYTKFAVWWVGLGILSSLGVGSGIQTSILFLLPHIMKTCLTAEACDSLDFSASGDMWFSSAEDLFACPDNEEAFFEGGDGGESSSSSLASVTYVGTFLKVYPACVLWGIGSAIGEIPPYALSYAAAEAGEENEEGEELRELGKGNHRVGKFDLVTRSKIWMISLLKRKGFLGIFLLSAIPNMAFDLCGMACGSALMPFWTFFGGTLLGKAVVRVWIQTAFFTMLFHEEHLESFISIVRRWTPLRWDLGGFLRGVLVQGKAQFQETAEVGGGDEDVASPGYPTQSAGGVNSGMQVAWRIVLGLFVAVFFVSLVEQVARRSIDEEERDMMQELVKKRGRNKAVEQLDHASPAADAESEKGAEAMATTTGSKGD